MIRKPFVAVTALILLVFMAVSGPVLAQNIFLTPHATQKKEGGILSKVPFFNKSHKDKSEWTVFTKKEALQKPDFSMYKVPAGFDTKLLTMEGPGVQTPEEFRTLLTVLQGPQVKATQELVNLQQDYALKKLSADMAQMEKVTKMQVSKTSAYAKPATTKTNAVKSRNTSKPTIYNKNPKNTDALEKPKRSFFNFR
jgi:hypothetical protein